MFLFGKRSVKAGDFRWQLPGGWSENREDFDPAARPEVREEAVLELAIPQFVAITGNIYFRSKHSISLYFEAECVNPDVVRLLESVKCKDWLWKHWSKCRINCIYHCNYLRIPISGRFQPINKVRVSHFSKRSFFFIGLS